MTIKKWHTLSSHYLFQRKPWLTIREDRLEMPNGTVMDAYYVYEYPDWVNTIAITNDGKFVMVEQYRHARGEVNFELCAGVMDDSDTDHLMTAQRELLEETGYGGGTWKEWMVNCANPGTHNNLTHCFMAEGVEKVGDQSLDDHEEIAIHLMTEGEVLHLLETNQIRQSLHAAALWKYFAKKNN
jgi:ADP-ribose pyrophosphatase